MLKLVILLSFATVLYGWDWSDDDYVVGVVGKWVDVKGQHWDCQKKPNGTCSSEKGCCYPLVCWMDGICRKKVPEYLSLEGLEYVTGKVGQYHRYDGCNNARKRIGEYCNKTSDCCFPLDCRTSICKGEREIDGIMAKFSAGWSLSVRKVL